MLRMLVTGSRSCPSVLYNRFKQHLQPGPFDTTTNLTHSMLVSKERKANCSLDPHQLLIVLCLLTAVSLVTNYCSFTGWVFIARCWLMSARKCNILEKHSPWMFTLFSILFILSASIFFLSFLSSKALLFVCPSSQAPAPGKDRRQFAKVE